jgi:high affinity Mn2+ porin
MIAIRTVVSLGPRVHPSAGGDLRRIARCVDLARRAAPPLIGNRRPFASGLTMRHLPLLFPLALVAAGLFAAAPARADTPPAPPDAADDRSDFMHALARHGLHDLQNERFNAYGQIALIGHGKLAFKAPYTDLGGSTNSLSPLAEGSWTGSATLFLGARLWRGAEAYVVPEAISERPLTHLAGLGSTIQNAELQKTGGAAPTVYLSRAYLRQTIGLGGARVESRSGPMQLGATVDSRRLVISVGKYSVLDFLDKNGFAGDLRRQFMNMAFLTHAAYDFAADARGYTWGATVELYLGDWALRAAHLATPLDPNQLPIDYRFWKYFGDQVEIEHKHTLFGGQGAVRVLGYLNRENMARFDDAVAAHAADPARNATTCTGFNYGSQNATAPDLCWARKPNVKLGIGVNVEQTLTDDVGIFFRGMYSDGQTEVYSFTSTDRSLSFGLLSRGSSWRRPGDTAGIAAGVGWISASHAAYLNRGGVDGFIGDGRIQPAAEAVLEIFYSVELVRSLWLSADYQHIANPAYNADRGPVDLFGGRLHAEF